MKIKFIDHMFMPQQTIMAIIRLHNNMTNDKQIQKLLLNKFNESNKNEVPKPGNVFKIPVIVQ